MNKFMPYKQYHAESMKAGDIDPSYEMLRYVCKRFELNTEQRFWLAFLYATCYCGPTVYYIYNEFPDYENVDVGRLERWWFANKSRMIFQSDRLWVRSKNQFVQIFTSYRDLLGGQTQEGKYRQLKIGTKEMNYMAAWQEFSKVYQFGRFAMFLYLEAVHVVTEFPMTPNFLDMREAESCRNGLAYAIEKTSFVNHFDERKLSKNELNYLQWEFNKLADEMVAEDRKNDIWNIETSLCAYKKYRIGKRHIGYYLDRQHKEIDSMQKKVPEGVCWDVLWDYRKETYSKAFLKEFNYEGNHGRWGTSEWENNPYKESL
jgi:hypothetical protein